MEGHGDVSRVDFSASGQKGSHEYLRNNNLMNIITMSGQKVVGSHGNLPSLMHADQRAMAMGSNGQNHVGTPTGNGVQLSTSFRSQDDATVAYFSQRLGAVAQNGGMLNAEAPNAAELAINSAQKGVASNWNTERPSGATDEQETEAGATGGRERNDSVGMPDWTPDVLALTGHLGGGAMPPGAHRSQGHPNSRIYRGGAAGQQYGMSFCCCPFADYPLSTSSARSNASALLRYSRTALENLSDSKFPS